MTRRTWAWSSKALRAAARRMLIEFIRVLDDTLVSQTVAGGNRRPQPRS